jgi:hypothetical protein
MKSVSFWDQFPKVEEANPPTIDPKEGASNNFWNQFPKVEEANPPSIESPPSQLSAPASLDGGTNVNPQIQPSQQQYAPSESDGLLDRFGKASARTAKTIGSVAVGAIPDLAGTAWNIPAMGINAAAGTNIPLVPSVTDTISKGIDHLSGGYTSTPEKEKWIQEGIKLGMDVLIPGLGALKAGKAGLKGIEKGLAHLGSTKGKDVGLGAVAGSATEVAHEKGYSTPAAIGIGLGASTGLGVLGSAAKGSKNLALKAAGVSPNNINLDIVDALERQGLHPHTTLVNENPRLAGFEKMVEETPFIGSRHQKNIKNHDVAYANKVKESLESVGYRISHANEPEAILHDAGQILQDTLIKAKESITHEKDKLYKAADQLLPEGATMNPQHTLNTIKEIRNNIHTLSPSPDEKSLLFKLDEIEKGITKDLSLESAPVSINGQKLNKQQLKKLSISPNNSTSVTALSGTKRSLNDVINWEVNAGGVRSSLKNVQGAIKQDLEEYGKQNKPWYQAHSDADAYYGKYLGDTALSSDIVKSIFSQKDPEKILTNIRNVSDFKHIETALGTSKEGAEFFNSLKREKLENLIVGKIVDPKTDKITYAPFAKIMADPKQAHLIKYLIGEAQFDKLKDFAKIAGGEVAKNARNTNTSGSTNKGLVWGTIFSGIATLAHGGSIRSAIENTLFASSIASFSSQLITNKKFLNYSINVAKAARDGDIAAANKWSKLADKVGLEELGEQKFRELAALTSQYQQEKNK